MVIKAVYPVQCSCGHLYLEKYHWEKVNENGFIGFCWCGFCCTKLMVRPLSYYEVAKTTHNSPMPFASPMSEAATAA